MVMNRRPTVAPGLEFHEEVDVAAGAGASIEDRTEDGEAAEAVPAAEGRKRIVIDVE